MAGKTITTHASSYTPLRLTAPHFANAGTENSANSTAHAIQNMPLIFTGLKLRKTREHKEQIDAQMAVVEGRDGRALGKGKALEKVIPNHHQCRRTSQSVEQGVVGFAVGKYGRWGSSVLCVCHIVVTSV